MVIANVTRNKSQTNSTVVSLAEKDVFIFLSVLSSGLVVCGIFCSIFILTTVRYSKLLTASSVLIGNLCVCTLLYSTLVLPIHIMTLLARSSVVGEQSFVCKSVSFLHVTINMASANAHAMIAAHRFLLLFLSGRFHQIRTTGFAMFLAVSAWVPSILTNIFPVLGLGSHHGFDRKMYRCTFGPPAVRAYALFSRLMLGVVPLVIMVALYAAIYWMRLRSQRRLGVQAASGARPPTRLRAMRRDYQATQICCIACAGFMIFYLPNAVLGLLSHFQLVNSTVASLVCNQFQIVGLSTNPLLYALFSRDLRVAMVDCLRRCRAPVMPKMVNSTTGNSRTAPSCPPDELNTYLAKGKGLEKTATTAC